MKISRTAKIETAVEPKGKRFPNRTALQNVYLDREESQAKLIATDGRILAIVPVEAKEGESGFISPEALKAARKLKGDVEVACNGHLALLDGMQFPKPDVSGVFPQWRKVLPQAQGETLRIGLNPSLLLRLSEAIGAETVELTIDLSNPDGAIHVAVGKTASDENRDNAGVIMPVKVKR